MYNSKLENLSVEKIKQMSIDELILLCSEIRQAILEITSIHGGHLSSNLGIVEIIVAAYYVFDPPMDKIIFDVSHQTYAQKIITGRYKELYYSLRENNGISGFSSKKESIYDCFEGGHSSTSISAGLGFLENNQGNVISIIGDASVSNGLAFEALNYLGSIPDKKMIVIINDNNMSVSKNVGSLAVTFNKLRISTALKGFKKIFSNKFKTKMQTRFYKNKLFTALNLKYFENINGHDLKALIKYFTYAKKYNKSIVLHCKTIKGKGYQNAENDLLGVYHSVSPFDINLGININNNSYGLVFSKTIDDYISLNNITNLRIICPGMSYGCGFDKFKIKYPNYFIDCGIAEENACEIASGMASNNLLPIVVSYSTFLQRGFDEIFHDIGRTNLHVIFLVDHAGIVERDGSTHQGIYDVSMFNTIPNIKILSIACLNDVKTAFEYALNYQGPIVIRYQHDYIDCNLSLDYHLSQQLIRPSLNNKYIITYGEDVNDVLNYSKYNDYGVISSNTINDFDIDFFNNLIKNSSITLITLEQVIYNNSMSMLLLSFLYQNNLLSKIHLVINTLPNTYLEIGSIDNIKRSYKLDLDNILAE